MKLKTKLKPDFAVIGQTLFSDKECTVVIDYAEECAYQRNKVVKEALKNARYDLANKLKATDLLVEAEGGENASLDKVDAIATLTIITPDEEKRFKHKIETLKACLGSIPVFDKMLDEIEGIIFK